MSEESRALSLQFEKSAVCKKMLDNYSRVTDQFYLEYGGNHANRDEAFEKEDSFTWGVYPRPTPLVLFEYFFIDPIVLKEDRLGIKNDPFFGNEDLDF